MNATLTHPDRSTVVSCVVQGDITTSTEKAFGAAVNQAIAAATKSWQVLEIDLRAVRIVDSKGLNLLVSIIKSVKAGGRRVRLVSPQASVRRILAFTRIDQHAEITGPEAA